MFDMYDPEESKAFTVSFLRKRTRIVEIIAAGDLIFCLSQSGVCSVVNRAKGIRIGMMNTASDEVIRSVFYNKMSQSVITVSVYRRDQFSTLRCRSTPISCIRSGKIPHGLPLFQSETIKYPGFVEFDELNGKILSYSESESVYRVWSMHNYALLFTIPAHDVHEVKIGHGVLLVIMRRQTGHVPVTVLDIEDGSILQSSVQILNRSKKIELIEQCGDKLLIKQEDENLHIVNLKTGLVTQASKTGIVTPNSFIYLHSQQRFLTIQDRGVKLFDFNGQMLARFEDVNLWSLDCAELSSCVFVAKQQDLLVSLSKHPLTSKACFIVSDIASGRRIACVEADAQDGTTALFYNEETNEIYTGNRDGMLNIWSN